MSTSVNSKVSGIATGDVLSDGSVPFTAGISLKGGQSPITAPSNGTYGFGNGSSYVYFNGAGVVIKPTGYLGFSSTGDATGATDITLQRRAAGVLSQYSGTQAQQYELYNTRTDASNYERGVLSWTSNVLEIGAEAAGTGSARAVRFKFQGQSVLFSLNSVNWSDAPTHYFKGGDLQAWKRALYPRVTDFTLDSANYGSATITNTGATGAINMKLPSSSVGLHYAFCITVAQYLRVTLPASAVIYDGTVASAAAGFIHSNVVGSTLTIQCVAANTWHVMAKTGTWTVDV